MTIHNAQPVTCFDGVAQQSSCGMNGQANASFGYGYMNPFTGLPLDKVTADKLYLELIMKNEDGKMKQQQEMLKQYGEQRIFEMRTEMERQKTENALRREEGIYKRKINREMARLAVFENSDGFLCLEMVFPNDERVYSKPIINCPNLRMYCLSDLNDSENMVGIVGLNDFSNQIILYGKFLSASGLGRMLEQKGIAITVCREKRKQTIELIFAYLMSKAVELKVPNSLGWHHTEQGWFFADRFSQTISGAKKGVFEFV